MVSSLSTSQILDTNNKLPPDFKNPELLHHTDGLKRSARAIINTASTVAGSNSMNWGGSERKSASLSVFGMPLDDTSKTGIEQWIPSVTIDEVESTQSEVSPETGETSQSPAIRSYSEGDTGDVSDSDGEIDFDIVQGSFQKAQGQYAEAKYAEAIEFYLAGKRHAEKLSPTSRRSLQIKDLRLIMGFSYLYLGKLDESGRLLNSQA